MRISVKNQYTSNQRAQKGYHAIAVAPSTELNNADRSAPGVLRVWRKVTHPKSSASSRRVRITDVNKPNGAIYTTSPSCEARRVEIAAKGHAPVVQDCATGATGCGVVRNASSNLRSGYYSTAKAYHQSRCIDPTQHDRSVSGSTGTLRPMTECPLGCNTTYAPRNRAFRASGAVSSGARTTKLQHNTLTRENALFRTTHGITMHSNYLPGAHAQTTAKSRNELNCNVGKRALTRVRHAHRSPFAFGVGCYESCECA